jgi:gluconokinase
MLSDMFNIQVSVSATVESSALGAVILGAEALGTDHAIRQEILTVHTPGIINHVAYESRFRKFLRLYDLLKEEMNEQ